MERKQLDVRDYITTRTGQIIPKLKGRQHGVRNKVNVLKDKALKASKKGRLPSEFLLAVSQGEKISMGKDKDGNKVYWKPDPEQRIKCAIAAAPYYSPRLSTVEVVKNTSDADLLRIIEAAAASAGIPLDLEKILGDDGSVTYELPVEET